MKTFLYGIGTVAGFAILVFAAIGMELVLSPLFPVLTGLSWVLILPIGFPVVFCWVLGILAANKGDKK